MSEILEDPRPIKAVHYHDSDGTWWKSGLTSNKDEIKIRAYGEPSVYCYVPYIAVEKNGVVIARFPATMVEIQYQE